MLRDPFRDLVMEWTVPTGNGKNEAREVNCPLEVCKQARKKSQILQRPFCVNMEA